MHKRITTPLASLALVAATAALPDAAFAVDGQVLIDHSKAIKGAITPGDAPGYPVTISRPGSYRLSGNLVVPDGNTGAIEIGADHVTLDLNGFAILGPVDCSGGFPCANAGSGDGVRTPGVQFNVTIRNGTIQGLGRGGIDLRGDSHLVEQMHARSNGSTGILIAASQDEGSSVVQRSTVQRNGQLGIWLSRGLLQHNTADVNYAAGLGLSVGSAAHNTSTRNGWAGLSLGPGASAIGNVMRDNAANLAGGVNLGQNLCTGYGGGC